MKRSTRKPGDGGQVGEVRGAACELGEALLRRRQRAGQELAFGPVQLEREGELVPALPRIVRQQRRTGGEIGQRRGVGRRRLGAPARDQVELGELLALLARRDQGGAAVELIDDLEDRLLPLLGRRVRREQSADPQVRLGARSLRGSASRRLPERDRGRTGRCPPGARPIPDATAGHRAAWTCSSEVPSTIESVVDLGDVAETGELLQRLLRFGRQAGELPDHEVHDVVGVPLGVNAIEIPAPARRVMIEGEQPFFGERSKGTESAKNGLPPVFSCTSCASGAARSGSQRSASAINCPRCSRASGASAISATFAPALLIASSLRISGWAAVDLVVAIGTDQQQVLHIRPGQQILEQIERRRVEPLQIVEEERQRMLRPGEHADEPPEHQLEAALRVLRRQLGTGGCSPMMSSSSGTRSTMSRPFGPSASSRASRQRASSASLLPSRGRTRL